MSEFTLLLHRCNNGDAAAVNELARFVYEELRQLAAQKMSREAAASTLQPTALVHEAWLRLGGADQPVWNSRAHFFGAAAEAMRRILIDRARCRQAMRHGGALHRTDLGDNEPVDPATESDERLLAVHDALDRLAAEHPRKADLVKLRYFAGFSVEEAAEALGIATPTAKRDWAFARAWLYQTIRAS